MIIKALALSLRDVPVGKDYAVIGEALSKADPPTLAPRVTRW